LRVQLPADYAEHAPALFAWLRDALIPAVLDAPLPVTLIFEPPSDRPDGEHE
jgi:hypothetical protein